MDTLRMALVNYQLALRKANDNPGVADVRYWEGYIEAWKRHLKFAGAVESDFDKVRKSVRQQLS